MDGSSRQVVKTSQTNAAIAKAFPRKRFWSVSALAADERLSLQLVFEILVICVIGELVERAGAADQLTATVRALRPVTPQMVEALGFDATVMTSTQRADDAAIPCLGAVGHERKRPSRDVQG